MHFLLLRMNTAHSAAHQLTESNTATHAVACGDGARRQAALEFEHALGVAKGVAAIVAPSKGTSDAAVTAVVALLDPILLVFGALLGKPESADAAHGPPVECGIQFIVEAPGGLELLRSGASMLNLSTVFICVAADERLENVECESCHTAHKRAGDAREATEELGAAVGVLGTPILFPPALLRIGWRRNFLLIHGSIGHHLIDNGCLFDSLLNWRIVVDRLLFHLRFK